RGTCRQAPREQSNDRITTVAAIPPVPRFAEWRLGSDAPRRRPWIDRTEIAIELVGGSEEQHRAPLMVRPIPGPQRRTAPKVGCRGPTALHPWTQATGAPRLRPCEYIRRYHTFVLPAHGADRVRPSSE